MRSTRSRRRHGESILALEVRRLMSATVTGLSSQEVVTATPPPILANLSNASSNTITLSNYFTDPNVPGTIAEFDTTEGNFDVALTDAATPLTVANFLSYVNSGAYNGTFFHRSVVLSNNSGGSPTSPADIIQAGGFNLGSGSISTIPTNPPVDNEVTSEQLPNVAGTIAMAKTSDPNSATDQFFFNVHDNPDLDSTSNSGGFTTFGHVLGGNGSSFAVIDAIAALPTVAIDTSTFTDVPVMGITEAQAKSGDAPVTANNLVFVNSVTAVAGTNYNVTSSNPTLVTPSVANGKLSFNYASGQTGTAVITVVANNLDGTSATTAFTVTVPDTANPTEGPTIATTTSAPITDGSSGTVNPLAADTDSVAALNGSTVSLVTQPAHGTATFNASTDLITYTPAAGFSGTDSLTYTVADTAGTVSSTGTVNFDVVPGPATVTIGTNAAKYLIFTEPSGQSGKLSVTPGTGTLLVTFANYQVNLSSGGGFVSAVGAGATISSIKYLANKTAVGSITISSSQPITVGSITSDTRLYNITAPTTTFTGTISIGGGNEGGLSVLQAAGLDGATLEFGGPPGKGTIIKVPTVVNSDIDAPGSQIGEILSNSWTVTDGGAHAIQAKFVGTIKVAGPFQDALDLSGTGYDLVSGTFNQPSGAWNLAGSIFRATVTNPTASWNVTAGGIVQQLDVTGTVTSTIQVAAVNRLSVKGSLSGAVIQTDGGYSKRSLDIGSLKVTGAISNSVVFSSGSIGTISAGSYAGSRIYAGVEQTIAQNAQLPSSSSSYTATAKINAVTVTSPKSTFSGTLIGAETLGSLNLGVINTSNGSVAFGAAGTVIGSVSGTLSPSTRFSFGKTQLKSATVLAAYIKEKKLTLGDFGVDIT